MQADWDPDFSVAAVVMHDMKASSTLQTCRQHDSRLNVADTNHAQCHRYTRCVSDVPVSLRVSTAKLNALRSFQLEQVI